MKKALLLPIMLCILLVLSACGGNAEDKLEASAQSLSRLRVSALQQSCEPSMRTRRQTSSSPILRMPRE